MNSELAIIGTRVPRVDGREKVLGRSEYSVDVRLPRMLHGKILRSPWPHARVKSIDTSRAARLSGVKAVITGSDIPYVKTGFIKFRNPLFGDNPILKGREGEKVRYIGDEVAAVAAIDEDTAGEALSLIDVDYELLPAVFDIDEAAEPGAPLVHDGAAHNTLPIIEFELGDVDRAFSEAAYVFEDTCTTAAQAHCCMETHAVVASWDANGRVRLWSSIQMPFLLRRDIADCLEIPESHVRVHRTTVGGRFGSGMEMHLLEPIACFLARVAQRPVRIAHTRDEEFVGTRFRHPMRLTMKSALDKSGRLLAREMRILTNNGAYTSQAPAVTMVAGLYTLSYYRIPAVRFHGKIVYTNLPYAGAFRGYGKTQGEFANEVHMNKVATEMGIDPVELRLINANESGDETAMGWRFTTCAFKETLRRAAGMIGWESVATADTSMPSPSVRRGIGIASGFDLGGGVRFVGDNDGCGAIIKVEDDGAVTVTTGGQEIGQGSSTVQAMVVAEVLGVPYESVRVENTDTHIMPWDTGTHASRTTFVAGNAVRRTAGKAREEILRGAAQLLEAAPEDLTIAAGRISVAGSPDRGVSVGDAVKHLHWSPGGGYVIVQDVYDPPTDMADAAYRGNRSATYCFCGLAVEIDVDLETGRIDVRRIVISQDVGRLINPTGAESQIHGAIAQALGLTLTEEIVWEEGETLTASFGEYKIPTSMTMPPIEIDFVETNDPEGPFGAKGLAELPMHPVPAAIVHALYNATGAMVTDLPLTPERVLAAIKATKRTSSK